VITQVTFVTVIFTSAESSSLQLNLKNRSRNVESLATNETPSTVTW